MKKEDVLYVYSMSVIIASFIIGAVSGCLFLTSSGVPAPLVKWSWLCFFTVLGIIMLIDGMGSLKLRSFGDAILETTIGLVCLVISALIFF